MRFKLTNFRFIAWLAIYTILAGLVTTYKAQLGIFSVIFIFPYLVTVPGLLLMITLRVKSASAWMYAFYTICLSILLLMVIGLSANWVLPLFGIYKPLSTTPLLAVFSVYMAALLYMAAHRAPILSRVVHLDRRKVDWSYLAPVSFIVLAVCGATRLNNGASNILTIVLLSAIALDFFYLFNNCRRLTQSKIIFHIFCISLSMLLMTSLRGWFITGHDIQREYYVFELAKSQWHWQVSQFRDPYNACLSITVLPTMFASLTKLSDPYIYKVLFQLLFAICPVGVYLLVQRISNRKLAMLAIIYFVSFPTFFMDMPMLNRQEVAFLFFTALLLMLGDLKSHHRLRALLFGLFGSGVIFSHYSTTYAVLLIFLTACIARFLLEQKWVRRIADKLFSRLHRKTPAFIGVRSRHRLVVIPMVLVLALVAFAWNVQITKTSGGLLGTLGNAMKSITGNIKNESRSSDTGASLFGGARIDPDELLAKYQVQQVNVRDDIPPISLYPASSFSKDTIRVSTDQPLPLTRAGRIVSSLGVNVYDLNYIARQSYAKILQLLVLIGLALIFFSKRLKLHPELEFIAASLASIFFLTLLVFVPVLSVDYGLLRAFQQVLIVLALPTAIGSLAVATIFTKKHAIGFTFTVAIMFFLTSTGLVAEFTGGYLAPLHLHNTGTYYDRYYIHPGEQQAILWTARVAVRKGDKVQADSIAKHRVQTFGNFTVSEGIYPGVVQKQSFVYMGLTNIAKDTAYALYQNEDVQYTYPPSFLNANKNLLYSTQQARIYK